MRKSIQESSSLFNVHNVIELPKKQAFEPSLHAFRGFAILNVVAIHVFGFFLFFAKASNPKIDVVFLEKSNEILFHQATIYFTLISGILFSLVLKQRGWRSFFRSKVFNVIFPYIFMTFLFTWSHYTVVSYKLFDEGIISYLQNVWSNLLTGDAIFTFWYIPVLLVLYLLTPVLVELMKHKIFNLPLIILALLPLYFSRVFPELSWTTYVSYLGVYVVGIYFGAHFNEIIEKIHQNVWIIGLIGFLATIVLWFLFKYEIKKWGIVSFQETAFYFQKLSFTCLAILLFKRVSFTTPKWLNTLGDYAFPIYFLHAYLLFEMYGWLANWHLKLNTIPQVLLFCLLALLFTLVVCVLITKLSKLVFGRWSRHLVGA